MVSYSFELRVYYTNFGHSGHYQSFDIHVTSEPFTLDIDGTIDSGSGDLDLVVTPTYTSTCPSTNNTEFVYTWTCESAVKSIAGPF